MKKLKLLLPISLLLLTAVLLSSCGHVHNIVIDPEVAPTCVATGKTEGAHCSSCGEVIVKQKEIPMVAHNIEKTGCTTCDLKASEGLEVNYIDYLDIYRLSLGDCVDENIIIPTYDDDGNYIAEIYFAENKGIENIKSIKFMDGRKTLYMKHRLSYMESSYMVSLESVELPEELIILGEKFFYNCKSLKNIDLPDDITDIQESTFENCTSLKAVELPENLIVISEKAFYNCSSLEKIAFPAAIEAIENSAFERCSGLTALEIPKLVETIGERAFAGCSNLKTVTMSNPEDRPITIGEEAFAGCFKLESVSLPPANRYFLEGEIFDGCLNLETIYFPFTMADWNSNYFVDKDSDWAQGLNNSCKIICTDGEIPVFPTA